MSSAIHTADGELAFARTALSLAWPDARRRGSAFRCAVAIGARVGAIDAVCEPGWIAVRASDLPDADPSRALTWSIGLAGGAKFAAAARGTLEVRAELAIDFEAPIALRLRAARAGITEALHRLATGIDPLPDAHTAIDAAVAPELVRAARDAGFVVHDRSEGRCAVELGGAGMTVLAEVAGSATGEAFAARVELVERERLDAVSRAALLRLLLRSNAAFRLVRAVLVDTACTTRAQLEVVFDSAPGPGEWHAALCALAVAARHTRREATALVDDPALARCYLASLRATKRPLRPRLETPDLVRPLRPNGSA